MRSLQDIEDEIATLSATISAATCKLLGLIGELDARDGWADPLDSNGFRSCAHWLSWRVGLSLGVARQYVKVARVLPELPRISDAFGRGEVSWSKVRALARIARPDNEAELLQIARTTTASQLEKLVRQYRRADVVAESDRALDQQRSRGLTTYFDSDGMLVVRGRLAPEQGALLMKALGVSTDELRQEQNGSAETPLGQAAAQSEPVDVAGGDELRADALVRMAERALDADACGAAVTDRYQVVVHVDAEVLADPAAAGRCELEDGPALAARTVQRIACDASLRAMVHGPAGELTAGRKTRAVSTPLRRALLARDGTRCAFPGCGCRGRDAHHVQAWATGGPTVLANLLSLCRRHHTFVHEGGYGVEAVAGGGFRFLRPDGRALEPAPVLPEVVVDAGVLLQQRWVSQEVTLTPDTGYPEWDGEPVDYDWVLGCLDPPVFRTDRKPVIHGDAVEVDGVEDRNGAPSVLFTMRFAIVVFAFFALAVPEVAAAPKSLRTVDWANRSYGSRSRLRKGRSTVRVRVRNPRRPGCKYNTFKAELVKVRYRDLTGDGKSNALVEILHTHVGCGGARWESHGLILFGRRSNRTVELTRIRISYLTKLRFVGRTLQVRWDLFSRGSKMTCVSRWKYNGSKLVRRSRRCKY